jgi:hypothetical protein
MKQEQTGLDKTLFSIKKMPTTVRGKSTDPDDPQQSCPDTCKACPHSEDAGRCESMGARWKHERWTPTEECKPKKSIVE